MLGLATPFKTQNYGTKLQAYAMQSIFTEMGYDTEIINFTYTSSKKRQARHTALAQKNLRQKSNIKSRKRVRQAMRNTQSVWLRGTQALTIL